MKKIYLLGAAFLISLGITGCTPATTTTPPASKPASTVEQQEKEVSLTIYRPTEDAMYLVPVTVKMKLKDDPPKAALAAMIADDRKQKIPDPSERVICQYRQGKRRHCHRRLFKRASKHE